MRSAESRFTRYALRAGGTGGRRASGQERGSESKSESEGGREGGRAGGRETERERERRRRTQKWIGGGRRGEKAERDRGAPGG